MLLNSVVTLSSFPYEKIGVFLDNTVAPESSARFGIRYKHKIWDYEVPVLNWSSLYLNQVGAEPLLLNSTSLSGLYDTDYSAQYVQPGNFIDIPDTFPLFSETSAYPNHYLGLTFKGGTSAITVYPSGPYPILTKVGAKQFNVSGGFFALSAAESETNSSDLYNSLDNSYLSDLYSSKGAEIKFHNHTYTGPGSVVYDMYPDAYVSASRNNFVLKTQNNNSTSIPLVNQLIPATTPYSKGIVPESFQLTFTVSAASLEDAIDYSMSYGNTVGATHFLSGINVEGLAAPIVQSAKLDSVNAKLSLTLNTGYFVPNGENYVVSYQASALPYIKSTGSSFKHGVSASEQTNYYQLSTEEAPYLYNYRFFTDYNNGSPEQETFTIFFNPEFQSVQYQSSSFNVSAVMVDNFGQLEFPILETSKVVRQRFFEENNDTSLSAIDLGSDQKYIHSQWFPASAHIKFINNGIANSFTVTHQISSVKDDLWYMQPYSFILNREKASSNLQITQLTDNWCLVQGTIYPNFDSDENVTWDVVPGDNIQIYDYSTVDDLIYDVDDPNHLTQLPPVELSIGVPTPANNLSIIVNNLGVDNTKITFYSSEFELSASTIWHPPSSVFNNLTLGLKTDWNDFNPSTTATISSFFIKNNLEYPAPARGSILWKETNNDPRGEFSLQSNDLSSNLYENVYYPSTSNTNTINGNFEVDQAASNPQKIIFNVFANATGPKSDDVTSNSYNISDSITIPVRQYPKNHNIYFVLSATDGSTVSSKDKNTKFFTTNNLSATTALISSDFAQIDTSKIIWNIPGNTHLVSTSAVFALASSYCIEVSALSAKPNSGNFEYYNFTDKLCINVLPSSYSTLDYISFPEYNMFPAEKLEYDYYNLSYLNSNGLTGLSGCTTNVILSTFGGFDRYYYQIGSKQVSSVSNEITIPVVYNDVSATGVVSITAHNSVFPIENGLTVYNYVSSTDADVFHQHMSVVPFPSLTAYLDISETLINVRNNSVNTPLITLNFPYDGITVDGTLTYVLQTTGQTFYSVSTEFTNNHSEQVIFSTDPSNFFSVKNNTYNTYNFFVTGNITKYITDGPSCTVVQPFTSNMISVSAYDGPDIEIWTPHHTYTTNQLISVYNNTTEFPVPFTSFRFDDGAGHITTGLTYTDVMTASYASEGTYNISVSAIGIDTVSHTWTDFFVIKNEVDQYDSQINRQFPDELELPYTLEDVLIKPNEWQYNTSINQKLSRLYTNFETLSSLSYAWDINVPKYIVGWLGEKAGKLTWHYETPPVEKYYTNEFVSLTDFILMGDQMVLINGGTIEFRQNNQTVELLNSTSHITEGEKFINPTHVVYVEETDKLVVLDKDKKNILVFDIDTDYNISLTHYWGGTGETGSKTHLNNPSDLYTDGQLIYVVDSDSRNIKIYNNYLNWTNEITYTGWTTSDYPVSVSKSSNLIYVLTNLGNIMIFDDSYNYVSTMVATAGHKLYVHNDFIHVLANNSVYVYAANQTFINVWNTGFPISRLYFDQTEIYAVNDFSIIKLIDYPQKLSIGDQSNEVSTLESMLINEDEPVTDFVYNDSFIKFHNNLLSFATSLTHKFVINVDEFDQFINHYISPIESSEILLTSSSYVALGINELISYETINRSIKNLWTDLDLLRQMVEVRISRDNDNPFEWTWKYHTIDKPQNISNNRRPLSWRELESRSTRFDNTLSAITWETAYGGGYERNHMPIAWTWDKMGCNCIWPVTWEQMECENKFGYTWEYLQNNCSFVPSHTFSSCLSSC